MSKNSMFINRELSKYLEKFAQFYSVIAVLGPRQSGKTTLVKHTFKDYYYINLENLDIQEAAMLDPRGFLENLLRYPGVIIDEFQNVPQLLSYIQVIVDREKKPGFFVLTGSQNFLMNESISQSLAGRVGILTLLPLSINEINNAHVQSSLIDDAIIKGSYPRLFEPAALEPQYIYPSYIQTYIERDIRAITNITNLSLFKKFLGLCAGRLGQLLNISSLANDCGVSMQTVKSWLSILEASYIIFLLQPHHKNFSKRLVKSPVLYFYDTGVACSLLGIESANQLQFHYMRGLLFENYIISDIQKQFYNHAKIPATFFWRDSHGNEIDCIIERANELLPIEIKSSMTMNASFLKNLQYWLELSGEKKGILVYAGDEDLQIKNILIKNWKHFNIFDV